jgi:hypothetical protein
VTEGLSLQLLAATIGDVMLAILPLAALFILFQVLFLKLAWREVARMLTGMAIAAVGLLLFLVGVALACIPFGRAIGAALASVEWNWVVIVIGLLLGLVTAWGEPAIRILADQVEEASAGSIRGRLVVVATCAGVAVSVALGLIRILYGIPLLYFLVPGYALVIGLMWFSDRSFVAIAVDAGGVATGPLANTFLLAVALGASAGLGDENPVVSGLGLASLISVAAIISIMALGVIIRLKQPASE